MQIRNYPRPLGMTGLSSVSNGLDTPPLARFGPAGRPPWGGGPPTGIALGPSNFSTKKSPFVHPH